MHSFDPEKTYDQRKFWPYFSFKIFGLKNSAFFYCMVQFDAPNVYLEAYKNECLKYQNNRSIQTLADEKKKEKLNKRSIHFW